MNIENELVVVKDEIPFDIPFGTVFSINTNKVTEFTHGFHKYPAKYIPQIPRWALKKYLNGNTKNVLDPFCGSGTTNVETILSGHNSFGIDIDPLSVLIAKVKTTKINNDLIEKYFNEINEKIKQKNNPFFKPACLTINHWFKPEYIDVLSILRELINKIDNSDIRELFIICFSSILRRVSNADNESQKAYVSHTKIKEPENPLPLFISQLKYYKDRIIQFNNATTSNLVNKIILADSSKALSQIFENEKFDLAITSPPYIKAIDYIYNQMVELFWIGDLFEMDTQTKQNEKKKLYIGSKHFHKKDYENYSPFNQIIGIADIDKKLQEVFTTDKKNGHKHSYLTFKYFKDLENHFIEVQKVLKKNAHYIMVVGDSNVSDIFFPTADLLAEIAKRNGFELENKWGYKIKNRFMRFDRKGRGGIIEIDWVLDFVNR